LDASANDMATLTHALEWEIIKKVLYFNQVLTAVSSDFNFSALCSYLFDLCQCFSKWYKECPIKNADTVLRSSRLFLASVVAYVIKNGLNILGIEAPNKI